MAGNDAQELYQSLDSGGLVPSSAQPPITIITIILHRIITGQKCASGYLKRLK
jgi:hypothetical protein